MTVWEAGQPRLGWLARAREDLGAIAYHYARLARLIATGTDPKGHTR